MRPGQRHRTASACDRCSAIDPLQNAIGAVQLTRLSMQLAQCGRPASACDRGCAIDPPQHATGSWRECC
eukprot:110191-Chlamydomonas_euryale.AAC.2